MQDLLLGKYVKEVSIAGSLSTPLRILSISDAGHTVLAGSRDRSPSPHPLQISDATQRMGRVDQRTVLHNVAKNDEELNIIELVLEDGTDVNAKAADRMTAFI